MISRGLISELLAVGVLACTVLLTIGCEKTTEPSDPGFVNLSVQEWQAGADGGDSQLVLVKSARGNWQYRWHVDCDSEWLHVTSTSGTTPDSFAIIVDSNKTGASRSGKLVVTVDIDGEYREDIKVVQDPLKGLVLLCKFRTDRQTEFLGVSAEYAYSSDNYGNLGVYDISTPSSPFQVGGAPLASRTFDAVVQGDVVYMCGLYFDSGLLVGGLQVIDVSTPSRPRTVSFVELRWPSARLAVSGDYVYLIDDYALKVFDVSDSERPIVASIWHSFLPGEAVAVCENYTLYSESGRGVVVLDNSDPLNLVPLDTLKTGYFIYDICARGGFAYVACRGRGVEIFDNLGTGHSELVAEVDNDGTVYRVRADDRFLYVGDWDKGLLVYDISTALSPTLVSSYRMPFRVFGLEVRGDYVYAVDEGTGLFVFRFVP